MVFEEHFSMRDVKLTIRNFVMEHASRVSHISATKRPMAPVLTVSGSLWAP